jgi:hypothetical protein
MIEILMAIWYYIEVFFFGTVGLMWLIHFMRGER